MPKTKYHISIEQAYALLGVAPDDDESVVKKAYRKKAFQLHPDRNKDPRANEAFLLVNEAYEMILEAMDDPLSRFAQRNQSNKSQQERHHEFVAKRGRKQYTHEEFEAKMKWARKFAAKKAKLHLTQFEEVKKTILYKIRWATSLIILITGLLVMIDFYWTQKEVRYISSAYPYAEQLHIRLNDDKGENTLITLPTTFDLRRGDRMIVKTTVLFDQIRSFRIDRPDVNPEFTFHNYLTIHTGILWVFVVFMLPIGTLALHGPRPAFYFFLKVAFWLPLSTAAACGIVMWCAAHSI